MSFGEDVTELVAESKDPLLSSADRWERVALGSVATVLNGFPWKSDRFGKDRGVPLIRIRDVTKGVTQTLYDGPIVDGYWVQRGDLLVGMDGDFNVRRWNAERGLLNQRVCKVNAEPKYYVTSFLAYALPGYLHLVNRMTSSVTVKHLSSRTLAELPLPLPPVAEQHRIVEKLDALNRHLAVVRTELDRVPKLAGKLRAKILIDAFRDMTRSACVSHDRWELLSASEVCEKVQSGGTPKAGFVAEGIPFLKVYNIVGQRVSFDHKPQFVSVSVHERELKKSMARPGDVLMNIVGPPLGKVAIVPDSIGQCNINQAITLFRPSERVVSKWLYYFLCSGQSVASVVNDTRGIAGQVNISLSQCRAFQIPIPPIQEQQRIIEDIEAAFTRADRLEAEATRARALLDRLEAAILAKAFRGELVPQDPKDEPASVLLDRIRAERAAAPKPKRGRARKAVG